MMMAFGYCVFSSNLWTRFNYYEHSLAKALSTSDLRALEAFKLKRANIVRQFETKNDSSDWLKLLNNFANSPAILVVAGLKRVTMGNPAATYTATKLLAVGGPKISSTSELDFSCGSSAANYLRRNGSLVSVLFMIANGRPVYKARAFGWGDNRLIKWSEKGVLGNKRPMVIWNKKRIKKKRRKDRND